MHLICTTFCEDRIFYIDRMVCENEEVRGLNLRTVNSHSFYLGNKAEKVEIVSRFTSKTSLSVKYK